MDHNQVRHFWNTNADAWTQLSRAGYDVYRDHLNTPAFLAMLPAIDGQVGLDIGCGEGHNTRLLAARNARMVAFDISEVFVRHASQMETEQPQGIGYHVASAVELPFAPASFDFVTAFMSFIDVPETEQVIADAYRVLRPGGFLQFSISHPCTDTPHRRNLRHRDGRTYAFEIGDYFTNLDGEICEWIFSAAPPEARRGMPDFRIPRFTRTLSQWFSLLLDTGFVLEGMGEPRPSDEAVRRHPNLQDAQVVPFFLHVRARKPV